MKDFHNKEIKLIIMNEINKLYNQVSKKQSVIDPSEFKEHLQKRRNQLDCIIDKFDAYMYYINEHFVEKYDFYPQSKIRIPIQMVAVDITLGKKINNALLNINENSIEKVSYFTYRANRLQWMLSRVDIDRTLDEFKTYSSKENKQAIKI